MHELERLYKLSGTGIIAGRKRRAEPSRPPALPGDNGPEGRWEVFNFTIIIIYVISYILFLLRSKVLV